MQVSREEKRVSRQQRRIWLSLASTAAPFLLSTSTDENYSSILQVLMIMLKKKADSECPLLENRLETGQPCLKAESIARAGSDSPPPNRLERKRASEDENEEIIERQCRERTVFLVWLVGTQQTLAPIHIPFEEFASSAAFLSRLAAEIDPAEQLEGATTPRAVSVRFLWSDFWIRIRANRPQDWELLRRELCHDWASPEHLAQRFKIQVVVDG